MGRMSAYNLLTEPALDDYFVVVQAAGTPGSNTYRTRFRDLPWLTSNYRVDIRSYGAIGDDTDDTAATNVTAIRAAMAAAVADRKALYIPPGTYRVNDNFEFDHEWSGLVVFGDGPSSRIKLATTVDEDSNVEAGWTFILDGTVDTLKNFRITGIRLDGNRANITGFDPLNTMNGVAVRHNGDYEGVSIDHCIVHSYKQGNGIISYSGGVRVSDCEVYDVEYNGFAASGVDATSFGSVDRLAIFDGCISHDNGGGFDVGRWCRTHVLNSHAYRNESYGMKYSISTISLVVRNVELSYNLGHGFTDTDTTGTADVDLDGIVTHHNGHIGFRCVSARTLRIGSIWSYDNYCRSGATRSGDWYTGGSLQASDIYIGGSGYTLAEFDAERVVTHRSPTVGIFVDGDIRSYRFGYIESWGAQNAGFADYAQQTYTAWATSTAYVVGNIRSNGGVNYYCTAAHTSGATTEPGVGVSWTTVWQLMNTSGIIQSGLMRENNKAAVAGAAGSAIICERKGSIQVRNVMLKDHQATPTQVSGMYFTSGVEAYVDGCDFGAGLTAGNEIFSATTGTRVRFGRTNTGSLVTAAEGTLAANGGASTASVTFSTAMSNLGGSVFFAQAVPASVDAAVDWYVSTANRTTFTVTKASGSFAAGTGNVSIRYNVQMEIQR